jgi:hypothetical protein
MGRLEPEFTHNQPVWWLAQQAPVGWGARSIWGGGGWGTAGNLWGDGVWGDGLWGDSRPNPNPWIGIGYATGNGPDEWGDNDPQYGIVPGAPRYAVFNGGPAAQPDGTTVYYLDASGPLGTVGIPQGSEHVKVCLNASGTFGTFTNVSVYVGAYAVLPVWPGTRRLRLIYRWAASSVGWYDWDGTNVPAGATLFTLTTDLDDTAASGAWPTVTGHWPASATVGGVTSNCPAAGAFTIHS